MVDLVDGVGAGGFVGEACGLHAAFPTVFLVLGDRIQAVLAGEGGG